MGGFRRATGVLGVCAVLCLGGDSPAPDRFDHVIVDAGHGGDDEGALGPDGVHEKDVVLDVARRLAERLRARGLHVTLTRDADSFVGLEQRTGIANAARGDLFFSIHANAARTRDVRGVEAYFLSLEASDDAAGALAARENQAFGDASAPGPDLGDPLLELFSDLIATEHLRESDEFARLAHAELAGLAGARPRGVRQAPFVVLMGLHMPAALVEIGFLTHPQEGRALIGDAHKDAVAGALERAVEAFRHRYDARREPANRAPDGEAG